MIYNEVKNIAEAYLLPKVSKLYGLEGYRFVSINAHKGGRNLVYRGEKEQADAKIIRIAFLEDRSRENLLGEVEYIRYLNEQGGSVANVISSLQGKLMEEISYETSNFYICVFEHAKGKLLADNYYRYREGAPLTEYYYNSGKVLGKLHQLSKSYQPVYPRYQFFDKYNMEYLDQLIPDSLHLLKYRMGELLKTLEKLDTSKEVFGMVHFDYSDGNYMINYDTGQITVFDFDNSCFCWYMYDLANLWTHAVGWIHYEQDVEKRRAFMKEYFDTVLDGYRSETQMDASMLEKLPLFIQITVLEGIVDAFEVMKNNNEKPECDEELSYLIKCMEDEIPYQGFFHEIYSVEEPFEYERREI